MKVALVYDRVNKWGGAENILLSLHKIFPDAPLYTSVYNSQKAPWANVFDIKTSFLQKFPFAASSHELYAALMPLAFESFSFDGYDLVISVTSEAAKGIITKPGTTHICYCLTPTRYLWSGYREYFKNKLFRFISKPIVSYLRNWDRVAARRPDKYIAISNEVKERIKKYYEIDSEVIYPPVLLEDKKESKITKSKVENSKFFLIVSRLVPYKRIDIAIRAFNELNVPLKIAGTGSQEGYLKSISNKNIEFLGYLTDSELVGYYKSCQALIFPGYEDFGLTILEAQSFGKPVIAFKKGGALETVIDGKTGEFFYPQTDKAIAKKIREFDNSEYKPKDCRKNAYQFSFERFKKEFTDVIARSLARKKSF